MGLLLPDLGWSAWSKIESFYEVGGPFYECPYNKNLPVLVSVFGSVKVGNSQMDRYSAAIGGLGIELENVAVVSWVQAV